MHPTLVVLVSSALAAAFAAVGAVPLIGRRDPPVAWMGWADALAAGVMLGVAYALLTEALGRRPLEAAAGAAVGVGAVVLVSQAGSRRVLLANAVHSGGEGVAIGAAMAVGLPFGILMAAAIAVHNAPEGTVLSAILRARGVALPHAAVLSVAVKASQVPLAVATYAIVTAVPRLLAATLGLAVGALAQLVMAELMPASYRHAGRTSIALLAAAALGAMVLLTASAP